MSGYSMPDLDKAEKARVQQVAFKAGRKARGEPSRSVLVNQHGVDQQYVNANWNWISRAWKAGATPKPMPRRKPTRGLGFETKEK